MPGGCDGNDDDDWLVSQILTEEEQKLRAEKALMDEFDILDDDGETLVDGSVEKEVAKLSLSNDVKGDESAKADTDPKEEEEEDDEYADMADFEDDNILEDEAAAVTSTSTTNPSNNTSNNSNVLKVRSYDVSITYDKYYQTPRVWLMGYTDDGTNKPLTGNEMMQDVISDYAHRTVTVENHPHVTGPHASIHPCQHGAVMKTIVRNLTKDGDKDSSNGPSVEMYLFIFLKFVR